MTRIFCVGSVFRSTNKVVSAFHTGCLCDRERYLRLHLAGMYKQLRLDTHAHHHLHHGALLSKCTAVSGSRAREVTAWRRRHPLPSAA